MIKPITSFKGRHAYLSNFYRAPVRYESIDFPTSEHAYQAAKSSDMGVRQRIADLTSPGEAKEVGRNIPIGADWFARRVAVMEAVLRLKFAPGTSLAKRLCATDPALLEEGNRHGDVFWGTCLGRGQNQLGNLLMRVRSDLLGGWAEVVESFGDFEVFIVNQHGRHFTGTFSEQAGVRHAAEIVGHSHVTVVRSE